MKLQYRGANAWGGGSHTIGTNQWPEGITHDRVVWDSSNQWTAEVSKEAGEWLLANEPNRWKEVQSEAKASEKK